ncbi:hypothetical protein [Catenulispora pinisilvae]|uniref:hypothetical protein n=1 Tax=Catenulispora pinisilvae TaxID=2705253 RepID=UPI001891E58A|nr:hypothetical protein [Catenulispora pinisilvae]
MAPPTKPTGPIRQRLGRTGQYVQPELTLGLTSIHADTEPPQAGFVWHRRTDGGRGTVRLAIGQSTVVAGQRITLIEVDGAGNGSVIVEIGPEA